MLKFQVMANLSMFSALSVLVIAIGSCAVTSTPVQEIVQPSIEPSAPPTKPEKNANEAVSAETWSRLRQGTGYVMMLRHAQTVPGTGDPPGFQLDDCATQRNLSAAGRVEARQIGQILVRENILINRVLSSQYCRCLETAELMDVGTTEATPMLNSIFEDRSTADQQVKKVKEWILSHRGKAGVIVMVTHFANISAVSGISLSSGDAVILQANENDTIEVVEQLRGL
jgi:phosphohistidine phosphatase SixA